MSGPDDRIRVLHVDDDPDLAAMVADYLEREDPRLDVRTATSAADGRALLAEGPVDCVVSDYDMPGETGIEFLRSVRADHPELPFVLYTGEGSEAVASEAISAGVTDYLQKEAGTEQYAVLANRVTNAVEAYRSRRALAEQNRTLRRYERMVHSMREAACIYDADGRFEVVNEYLAEWYGTTRAALVGERSSLVPAIRARADGDPFEALLDGDREELRGEIEAEFPDHGEAVLEYRLTPLRADGAVEGVVAVARDVTERRERERRLEETTSRLEALFDRSPDMINVHDRAGNIIDPNPALVAETGYSEAELTDMKVWDVDTTLDAEAAERLWAEMEHGDRERLEGVYRRRDGSTFPVEVHVRRLDLDGEDRFLVVSRDMSERERRERELEETNQLLSTLFETLPVGVVVLDADGDITRANRRAETVLGLDAEAITTRTYDDQDWDVYDEDGDPVPGEMLPFARVLATGEPVYDVEHGLAVADGEDRWLSVNAAPITSEEGDVERVVSVVADVTEARERERAVAAKNERLEQFASVVSHDLRNPLNVATGRLELAREEHDSEHLVAVERALERMETLVTDLLSLARDGDDATDVEAVDLGALVEDCWRAVDTGDATLVCDLDATVRADASRLRQLFENLVRNAVEHGSTGSRTESGDAVEHGSGASQTESGEAEVTVTVGPLADGFYVEDDGPGVPADEREAVFEAGHTTTESGTGFGLAIVRQVAEAHGWSVGCTGSDAGGARFEVTGVEFVSGR